MSQIEDLQARITRALDRIGQGIDGMQPAGPDPEEFDALRRRAEAAEQALAESREALAAARDQTEVDREAAVAAARAEAAEEMERALAEVRAEASAQDAPAAATGDEDVDVGALQEALEDERMANAQLEERLRVLRDRLARAEAVEPAAAGGGTEAVAALDAELQKLRAANEELMASNAALREANAQGVGEPELINRGLEAELDGLRAARAAEAAEAGAVLGALTPLLAQTVDEEAQG